MTGPLPYIGGKRRIAKTIIALFPDHTTYVEPFAGGAQVLFHKSPSKVEIINDLDGDVANFFRICQLHYEELLRYLRFVLVSRRWFALFESENPESLTDVQRAARFYVLQKQSFAGLVRNPHYSYAVESPPSFNPLNIPKILEKAHQRLAKVQIECVPYEEILDRYDRAESLFFLDPPYYGRALYRHNFAEKDFEVLAERLRKIKGKFLLSLNDTPKVRTIFSGFPTREISFHYTSQRQAGKRYPELLITNY